jgi:hypothetical protein
VPCACWPCLVNVCMIVLTWCVHWCRAGWDCVDSEEQRIDCDLTAHALQSVPARPVPRVAVCCAQWAVTAGVCMCVTCMVIGTDVVLCMCLCACAGRPSKQGCTVHHTQHVQALHRCVGLWMCVMGLACML